MRWGVRLVVVLLLVLACYQVHRIRRRLAGGDADPAAVARLKESLERLPVAVGDGTYRGEPYELTQRIVDLSGADTYAARLYRDGKGGTFRLYVGGSISNDENFHAPTYCMPAAGWEILENDTVPFFAYPVADAEPRMRRLVLQYGADRMLVYYWFQAGDRLAHHEWIVRYYRFLDLLSDVPLRPTLIVTLYVPIAHDLPTSEREAEDFLRAIGPSLRTSLIPGAS